MFFRNFLKNLVAQFRGYYLDVVGRQVDLSEKIKTLDNKINLMNQKLDQAEAQRTEEFNSIKSMSESINAKLEETSKKLERKPRAKKSEKPAPEQLSINFTEEPEAEAPAVAEETEATATEVVTEEPVVEEAATEEKPKGKRGMKPGQKRHSFTDIEKVFMFKCAKDGKNESKITEELNKEFADMYESYRPGYRRSVSTVHNFFAGLSNKEAKRIEKLMNQHHKTANSIWGNPENFQKVIRLMLSGYKSEEIGNVMGVTKATIENYLSKRGICRSRLATEMANYQSVLKGGGRTNDSLAWSDDDRQKLLMYLQFGFACDIIAKCLLRTDGAIRRQALDMGYYYHQNLFYKNEEPQEAA